MAATARRPALRSLLDRVADSQLGDALDRFGERARENPAFLPALVCVLMLVWFGADEGGFGGTTFLPGCLLVLALLAIALATLPRPRPARLALIAVGAFAAYALWSYLSILWADDQGIAWDGANRTLLYAALLALCSLWPMRAWAVATLLGAFGLGVAGVGLVELIKVEQATQAIQYFHEGRLSEPAGYANANVALWFTAFWPCLLLAARREVPAALRGLFLACSTLLAGLAVLGQSRGWLFALAPMLALVLVVVPGRGRTITTLVAVAGALAMVLGPLVDVYRAIEPLKPPGETYSQAVRMLLAASAGIGLAWAGGALCETTVRVSALRARRVSGALLAVVVAAAVIVVAGYAGASRSPLSVVADKWSEFKKGGSDPGFGKSRFSTALATYRYDYWRVAWQEFERHPLTGVGVDNFRHDYLQWGKSYQTPAYPHSTPLRALSETGTIGGLLFFGAMAAAIAAAIPALRGARLGSAAAGTGLVMWGYWLVHGSVDWFWEFPALGGAAFLGLGAAIALAGARGEAALPGLPLLADRRALALAGAAALVLGAGLVLPWMAERDLDAARASAGQDPASALARLARSADVNPLSPLAQRTAGLIRVRQGQLQLAKLQFEGALARDRRDPFSLLMLGAIASKQGQAGKAILLVRRARALSPRWAIAQDLAGRLSHGRHIDPQGLESAFREDIRARIGPD